MSVIALDDAKKFLRVIHAADDELIQQLLDSAEDEALQFMDRDNFGDICPCDSNSESEPEVMPSSVRLGVYLLLQGAYQARPEEIDDYRNAAEIKLMPYRCNLGV